ncbi:MAG: hypothetical protein ABIJ57_09290 [Pseudomonadota bacterium]
MSEDLNRVMAKKVMQYRAGGSRGYKVYQNDEGVVCDTQEWQPSLRIEQAMECWETFHTKHKPKRFRLNTYTDDTGSVAEIWIGAKLYCRGPLCQSGLAEAICLALKEVAENE